MASSAPSGSAHLWRILLFSAILVALILLVDLDVDDRLRALLLAIEDLGPWAPAAFVLVHAAAIVLLLPGAIFPLAAGLLFGVAQGSVLSVLAKVAGSSLAFLIARHLLTLQRLPPTVRDWRQRHPGIERLLSELPRGGYRTVMLIRLVPVIPFKVSSYAFGWTLFRYRDFALGTLLAAVPYSVLNAHIGSLAADVTSLGPRPRPDSTLDWALSASGLLLASVAAVLVARRAARLLREGSGTESRRD